MRHVSAGSVLCCSGLLQAPIMQKHTCISRIRFFLFNSSFNSGFRFLFSFRIPSIHHLAMSASAWKISFSRCYFSWSLSPM
ncbi:uncharacterized protein EI97DRAFT_300931 [Westerdykella ornata]|uniref:Uncharacterized protein n=1 Tax=Westerdykella ornata TaxID=318751 RepID=A0A6A6JNG0_WESOR|nr:uncharacterized protein EI97DRAFT_300931 [Westerdykella ornata]KAF2277663.1 hypothetical protein EI97DRAFT_300931 [Westerdykella ornata]